MKYIVLLEWETSVVEKMYIYASWQSTLAARNVLFEVRTEYLYAVQGISRQLTVWFIIEYWNVIFLIWFCTRPVLLGSRSTR